MFPEKCWKKSICQMKQVQVLAVLLIPVVAFMMLTPVSKLWASRSWIGEFEDAECGFEVNVTDFDTGFFACVDAEGWKWLNIYRQDSKPENGIYHVQQGYGSNKLGAGNHLSKNYWGSRQLLFSSWASGRLRYLGITELCFESSEPEGKYQEILDKFPEGECKFVAKGVDGSYLKSKADLTHDFACPPNPEAEQIRYKQGTDVFEPFEDGTCVEPGEDLIIEWDELESKLVDVRFAEENGEEIVVYDCENGDSGVEIDGYEVVVETGELESGDDFEPSQTLTFDPFDEGTSVTIPGDFIKDNTPYKFEHLTIEESGNKSIIELEFATGVFCED